MTYEKHGFEDDAIKAYAYFDYLREIAENWFNAQEFERVKICDGKEGIVYMGIKDGKLIGVYICEYVYGFCANIGDFPCDIDELISYSPNICFTFPIEHMDFRTFLRSEEYAKHLKNI